jgi:Fe2+ transport system protein B
VEASRKADETGKEAKRFAGAAFRAAEELSRKSDIDNVAAEEAIEIASRVSGAEAQRAGAAGKEAKDMAEAGLETAGDTRQKADAADRAGDRALEAAIAAFATLLSQSEEAALAAREAADKALKEAERIAAEAARKAAEAEAMLKELEAQLRQAAEEAMKDIDAKIDAATKRQLYRFITSPMFAFIIFVVIFISVSIAAGLVFL